MTWIKTRRLVGISVLGLACCWAPAQSDGPKPAKSVAEAQIVERVIAARKEYMNSLIALYQYYDKNSDNLRKTWVGDELKAYHLMRKPSYRLDILDVPMASLEPKVNIKEANELFKLAKEYKEKSASGNDYILNQRRAELLFQEILQRYGSYDKLADVAYELADMYEGRAYDQPDRAAAYFERAALWKRGVQTDATLRAARLYDKKLNERSKAIDMYRKVLEEGTDMASIKEAERRIADLSSTRK